MQGWQPSQTWSPAVEPCLLAKEVARITKPAKQQQHNLLSRVVVQQQGHKEQQVAPLVQQGQR
jgi:hypothetical protein